VILIIIIIVILAKRSKSNSRTWKNKPQRNSLSRQKNETKNNSSNNRNICFVSCILSYALHECG